MKFPCNYTANPVPVIKTGNPCAHILTGKTWSQNTGILFSLQETCFQNREFPVLPRTLPPLIDFGMDDLNLHVDKYDGD